MSQGRYHQKKKREERQDDIVWGKVILFILFLCALGYAAYEIKAGFDKKNKKSTPTENIENKTEDDYNL